MKVPIRSYTTNAKAYNDFALTISDQTYTYTEAYTLEREDNFVD